MSFLNSAGQLHHFELGAGSPTLVFLHGTAGDHTDFDSQIQEFKSTHRVIAFDLRGHGKSPQTQAGYSVPELASDVAEALSRLKLLAQSVVLIGHSLGGLVALELAALRLEIIRSVILIDAPMLIPAAIQQAIEPYTKAFQGPEYSIKLREFAEAFYFSPSDDAQRKQARIARLAGFSKDLFNALWMSVGGFDAHRAASLCRVPGLYIHASVPADLDVLRRIAPSFSIVKTRSQSHYVQIESAEEVNAFIRNFVT